MLFNFIKTLQKKANFKNKFFKILQNNYSFNNSTELLIAYRNYFEFANLCFKG